MALQVVEEGMREDHLLAMRVHWIGEKKQFRLSRSLRKAKLSDESSYQAKRTRQTAVAGCGSPWSGAARGTCDRCGAPPVTSLPRIAHRS